MIRRISLALPILAFVTACGGTRGYAGPVLIGPFSPPSVPPSAAASCPPPSPGPTPIPAFLDYPPSGSSNVAAGVGEIIEKGADYPGEGVTIVVSSQSGSLPLGAPTIAPSPYPSPFATPPPTYGMMGPYMAIPLPSLAPSTAYTVSDVYTDWADNPPACSAQYTQFVGSFTTGP